MPSIPLFIVTSIKQAKRQANKNAFTGRSSTEPMYQVKMCSGFFSGVGVTFSYPDENKASAFAQWELYNPSQIIEQAAPAKEPFVVQDIYKTKGWGKRNLYTDKPEKIDSWSVSMNSPEGSYIDLWYPSEGEAYQWGMGRTYTVQDLFGTLKAPLFEMSAAVDQAAGKAAQAKKDADAAKKAVDKAAWDAEQFRLGQQTVAADAQLQAYLQQVAAAANASALNAGASAAVASQVANSVLLQTQSTFLVNQPNLQQVYYWVTNGGAAGWYAVGTAQQIGEANNPGQPVIYLWQPGTAAVGGPATPGAPPAYTHYTSGTFNNPANGILLGSFVSDASVVAGIIQPYH